MVELIVVNMGNSFFIVGLFDEYFVVVICLDQWVIEVISEEFDLIGYYFFLILMWIVDC